MMATSPRAAGLNRGAARVAIAARLGAARRRAAGPPPALRARTHVVPPSRPRPAAQEHEEPQQPGPDAAGAPGPGADAAALDAFSALPALAAAIQQLSSATADPTAFLQPSSSISDAARAAAKALYGYALQSSSSKAAPGGELHVEQPFDAEQIWLQLELHTEPLVKRSRRLLKRVGEAPQLVTPEVRAAAACLPACRQPQPRLHRRPAAACASCAARLPAAGLGRDGGAAQAPGRPPPAGRPAGRRRLGARSVPCQATTASAVTPSCLAHPPPPPPHPPLPPPAGGAQSG
jgi:hypothetical protein